MFPLITIILKNVIVLGTANTGTVSYTHLVLWVILQPRSFPLQYSIMDVFQLTYTTNTCGRKIAANQTTQVTSKCIDAVKSQTG